MKITNAQLIANRNVIIAQLSSETHFAAPSTIYIPNKNGEHEGTLSFDEKDGIVSLLVHRDAVNKVVELELEFHYEVGTVLPTGKALSIQETVTKFNDLADDDILSESHQFRTAVEEFKEFLIETCGLTLQGAKYFFAMGAVTTDEWQDEDGIWHDCQSQERWFLNTEGF